MNIIRLTSDELEGLAKLIALVNDQIAKLVIDKTDAIDIPHD